MPLGKLIGSALLLVTLAVTPALAHDHRDDRRHGRHEHGHRDHDRKHDRHHARFKHCPPGLAKKGRDCVPPGHARKRHHLRIGDAYDRGNRGYLGDPRRYNLQQRDGWNYYRDDDRIYRVDSHTRKVLAVINLMQAFSQ